MQFHSFQAQQHMLHELNHTDSVLLFLQQMEEDQLPPLNYVIELITKDESYPYSEV